jgi:hypothetical protein
MIGSVFGIALAMSTMGWHDNTRLGRPIATVAPYPEGMADDVHRPGFNGMVWASRPIIGGTQGPYPDGYGHYSEQYGAFGNENAAVYVRVGGLVVAVNAFEPIPQNGMRRFEEARNFWLKENGYVGGVRTFVNDAYAPKAEAAAPAGETTTVSAKTKIEPRATIQLPADMPRRSNRLRVDAGSNGAVAIAKLEHGWARVSWPEGAPADAVARTQANGGMIKLGSGDPAQVVAAAH